jgi:hypothetical protein
MEPILIVIVGLVLAMVIGFVVRKAGGTAPDAPSPPRDPAGSRHGTESADDPPIEKYPTGSRPGGPGAEAMNPAEPGGPVPGEDDASAYGTEDAVAPSEASRKPLDD